MAARCEIHVLIARGPPVTTCKGRSSRLQTTSCTRSFVDDLPPSAAGLKGPGPGRATAAPCPPRLPPEPTFLRRPARPLRSPLPRRRLAAAWGTVLGPTPRRGAAAGGG
eukprot:7883523-Alexandrium_andersonii.AAC.1